MFLNFEYFSTKFKIKKISLSSLDTRAKILRENLLPGTTCTRKDSKMKFPTEY